MIHKQRWPDSYRPKTAKEAAVEGGQVERVVTDSMNSIAVISIIHIFVKEVVMYFGGKKEQVCSVRRRESKVK